MALPANRKDILQTIKSWYKRVFSIEEIEGSAELQIIYFAILIGFWVSFNDWIFRKHISVGTFLSGKHVCPPYFQNCGELYFLNTSPMGYSQSTFYGILLLIICLSAYFAVTKKWIWAHFLLVPLTLWKCLVLFVLTYQVGQNFEYFHLPFVMIFLVSANRLIFMRRLFVLLYALAATVKFHDSWVTGSYFTSLDLGIPIFPANWTPFLTNFVILIEILASWLLLSSKRPVRLSAVGLWCAFHIYSVSLIGYRYPAYCLPLLFGLFLADPKKTKNLYRLSSAPGWLIIASIFAVNIIPNLRSGDPKYTLQDREFGLYMFDATHQCVSNETWHFSDGTSEEKQSGNIEGMNRCGPYPAWFAISQRCKRLSGRLDRVGWEFLSSINGGPFYRLVRTEDACQLKFSATAENGWIQSPVEGQSEIVGYPRKTITREPSLRGAVPQVYPDQIDMSVPSQAFFIQHRTKIVTFWRALWVMTFLFFTLGGPARRILRTIRSQGG